ncbi:helix-turn-helix transcriptional regulator [bacterium LRH843]|nr:helix-turn-helix transcriptional regulator [bacterium LRH843]
MNIDLLLKKYIGENVRGYRITRDITIAEHAYYSDLNNTTISNIELGKSIPSVLTLYYLSAGLGLDVPNLLLREATEKVYPLLLNLRE